MANIVIRVSEAFADADRVRLSACVVEVLEKTLNLPVSASFFQFEEIPAVDDLLVLSVQLQLFPACSGRMRRAACLELVKMLSERMEIDQRKIEVSILSPSQEKVSGT